MLLLRQCIVLVVLLCPTFCSPIDCSLPGFSVMELSRLKYCWLVDLAVLTQGLNPGVLHCRQILYHLRHQWSPLNTVPHLYSLLHQASISMKVSWLKFHEESLNSLLPGWGKSRCLYAQKETLGSSSNYLCNPNSAVWVGGTDWSPTLKVT